MLTSDWLVNVSFIALLVFTAVAFALFITYKILKKYNDFGDSSCKMDDYALNGIRYERQGDRVPTSDKYHLFADYGNNPYEDRKHSIPEVLLKNAENDKQDFEDEF